MRVKAPGKVLVMLHPQLCPPESMEGVSDKQADLWRTEYDVIRTLRAAGHELQILGVDDSLTELRSALLDQKPSVVFNLLEEFNGIVAYDQHVVAYLELMQRTYTGCNPRGLLLSRDKVLCKQLLSFHRIPTPKFAVFKRGATFRLPKALQGALFVKSATDDASLGLSKASLVDDPSKLRERVEFMHEQTGSDVLVEEYIEGRELYVGVIGNDRLTTLPIWELSFGTSPAIATRRVKWDRAYQQRNNISTGPALDLDPALQPRIDALARRIYRALHLSGYARIDLRLRADGALFVLEANANPNLAADEDFAAAAAAAGIGYTALLERILRLGQSYQAAWRQRNG